LETFVDGEGYLPRDGTGEESIGLAFDAEVSLDGLARKSDGTFDVSVRFLEIDGLGLVSIPSPG
jgi:hypothetical protein